MKTVAAVVVTFAASAAPPPVVLRSTPDSVRYQIMASISTTTNGAPEIRANFGSSDFCYNLLENLEPDRDKSVADSLGCDSLQGRRQTPGLSAINSHAVRLDVPARRS